MRRGEVWTVSGVGYAGKPRPAVLIQDDLFDGLPSVTLCTFTTDETDAPVFRLLIEPSEGNGLSASCRLMVDKIVTVPKSRLGKRIGALGPDDTTRLNRAVLVFLGLV